ncbi:hypothetical protein [Cupriavidus basilensis]|uniref:hypothetical protein n=1 Tax=Cupriavidus basilensis TaxID=68895 RepID=UPI0011863855|nr:hypothetical protein [Cupriavidus basilensis]
MATVRTLAMIFVLPVMLLGPTGCIKSEKSVPPSADGGTSKERSAIPGWKIGISVPSEETIAPSCVATTNPDRETEFTLQYDLARGHISYSDLEFSRNLAERYERAFRTTLSECESENQASPRESCRAHVPPALIELQIGSEPWTKQISGYFRAKWSRKISDDDEWFHMHDSMDINYRVTSAYATEVPFTFEASGSGKISHIRDVAKELMRQCEEAVSAQKLHAGKGKINASKTGG